MSEWLGALKATVDPTRVSVRPDELAAHGCDSWPVAIKVRQQARTDFHPEAVVYPVEVDEVSDLLRWAASTGVPVTPWGRGSAVTGSPLPLSGGISLDLSRMDRILDLNDQDLTVTVEAGVRGDVLEGHLQERGFALKHSPQSLHLSTVGGWVSTLATGQFSSRYGGIEDLVVSLTVVLPDGEVIETLTAPRAALGPDLKRLFIGAEGTLGVVATVTLRIFPSGDHRIHEAVAVPSVQAGLEVMRRIMRAGLRPFLVRLYDPEEARHAMRDEDLSSCVLFLGFEGEGRVARAEYEVAMDICSDVGGERLGPSPVEAWMGRRFDFSVIEDILGEAAGVAETIEVANFWSRIHETYSELKRELAPFAEEVLGHFSHVYTQGTSLYIILLGSARDERSAGDAEATLRAIWEVANRVALRTGAVTAHHHGAGIARSDVIEENLGSSMAVLRRIKESLDPGAILCPGKLGLRKEEN